MRRDTMRWMHAMRQGAMRHGPKRCVTSGSNQEQPQGHASPPPVAEWRQGDLPPSLPKPSAGSVTCLPLATPALLIWHAATLPNPSLRPYGPGKFSPTYVCVSRFPARRSIYVYSRMYANTNFHSRVFQSMPACFQDKAYVHARRISKQAHMLCHVCIHVGTCM